jgi:TatD family-associated radical SAM protein
MAIISYEIKNNLYLNVTNRCTNRCSFCIRNSEKGLGLDLWLEKEPEFDDIIRSIGSSIDRYETVVFCGYGEPLLRLPLVLKTAEYLKKLGRKIRIDTNGQGRLICGDDVANRLSGYVDAISISLNASNGQLYQDLCDSEFGEDAYDSILSFARDCVKAIPDTTLTVVDTIISEEEMAECRKIADGIGAKFKVRHFQQQ